MRTLLDLAPAREDRAIEITRGLTRGIWRLALATWVLAIVTSGGCDTETPGAQAQEQHKPQVRVDHR